MHSELPIRRIGSALVLAVALTIAMTPVAPTARAQDSSNDLLTIAKSSLFGGLVGLVLGGVTALVVDSDKRDDSVRWGIVLGTFGGFAYGVYSVTTGQDDDDFFGSLGDESAQPFQRPLPGVEGHDRFADLEQCGAQVAVRVDPFRTTSPELTPIAWNSSE
jgi:hypothetical protein